jgi:transketolase
VAMIRRKSPTMIVLSRQSVPTLDRELYGPAGELARGAYIMADIGDRSPELILMASGSEVGLIVAAGERLAAEGVNVRLVSFPSWELFEAQEIAYREQVLPPAIKVRLAVEAGISQGWERWVGERGAVISVETYGASAPVNVVFEKYGFTADNVIAKARAMLG